MLPYKRADRVGELVHREICQILREQVKDPRVNALTVIKIELSHDLQVAKVFVSLIGDDKQKKLAVRGLESAKKFIRRELGRSLELRYTPELIFRYDESLAHAQHIHELIEQLKQQSPPDDHQED